MAKDDKSERAPATEPAPGEDLNPWVRGDGPRPTDEDTLVAQIKCLAAARQHDARFHVPFCACDGCRIRRQKQERFFRNAS